MSSDIQVRIGTTSDLPAVVGLWARQGGPSRTAGGLQEATALIERDPDALIVAVDGDGLVGAVIAGWDGWRFHIYRLAVEGSHRRRGVSLSCCQAAVARFSDRWGS
jgi:ribosomal protein S18 acetylase RimI-like enzyme